MQRVDLSPEEIAFLTQPAAASGPPEAALAARLTRRLAGTLSARLRLPVEATTRVASTAAAGAPAWQVDAVLATLWLTRRLGGRHVAGTASRVPQSLIRTLDAMLAECWLDAPAQADLPPALAWHVRGADSDATLALQLPCDPGEMTRWAREIIRHG